MLWTWSWLKRAKSLICSQVWLSASVYPFQLSHVSSRERLRLKLPGLITYIIVTNFRVSLLAGPSNSVGGVGTADLIPSMPPKIDHAWVQTSRRHRVDSVRRTIHALNAQRVLVFMNFQSRLQVVNTITC